MTQRGDLDPGRTDRAAALRTALAAVDPTVVLHFNRNRRLFISLRLGDGRRSGRLSLHEGLLDEPAVIADLPRWLAQRGRGRYPAINAGMRALHQRLSQGEGAARGGLQAFADVAPLGGPIDLHALLITIHSRWFSHTSRPTVAWARASHRQLSSIRFGSYRRRPVPLIQLHPRLDQPWVARIFVEHVLFHELCHHAQACRPIRGESAHSQRFRDWERRYPDHERALAWERAHLSFLLAGSIPPAASATPG